MPFSIFLQILSGCFFFFLFFFFFLISKAAVIGTLSPSRKRDVALRRVFFFSSFFPVTLHALFGAVVKRLSINQTISGQPDSTSAGTLQDF